MRIDDVQVGGLYRWEHDGRGAGRPVKAVNVREVNGLPGRKAVVEFVDRDGCPETDPEFTHTTVLPARELTPWNDYWTQATADHVWRQEDAAAAAVALSQAFEAAGLWATRLSAVDSTYVNLRLDPDVAHRLAALLTGKPAPEVSEGTTVG